MLPAAKSIRSDLTLLGLLMTAVYLLSASHGPISSATRYYEASREMVELDDWVVPHLVYTPYLEKPPLVYWLGGLAYACGDHPLITSLPSLLAVLSMLAATYLFGRWWRDRALGLTAAGLLGGATIVQAISGVLLTDTLLAGCLAWAWVCWWRWDRAGRIDRWWLIGFYLAIAVGWLAKGPIALALPGAGIATYALMSGGWRGIFTTLWTMRPWLGLGLILLVNLPWTLALWWRDPRLVEFFYLRINLEAFVDGSYNHRQPWYYYGPTFCGWLAPYTLLAIPMLALAVWQEFRQLRSKALPVMGGVEDATSRYLVAVLIGSLVFLSLSSAKLGTYIMPIMPVAMLLLADGLGRWQIPPLWMRVAVIVQAAGVMLVVALAPLLLLGVDESLELGHPLTFAGMTFAQAPELKEVDWSYTPRLMCGLGLLLVAVLGSVVAVLRGNLRWALGSMAFGTTLLLMTVLPIVDQLVPKRDARPLITALRQRQSQETDRTKDIILLHDSTVHSYELMLDLREPVGVWGNARETGLGFFVQAHAQPTPIPGPHQPIPHPYKVSGENTEHPRLWSSARLTTAWNSPQRVWLIADEDVAGGMGKMGLEVHEIARARYTVLLSNHP